MAFFHSSQRQAPLLHKQANFISYHHPSSSMPWDFRSIWKLDLDGLNRIESDRGFRLLRPMIPPPTFQVHLMQRIPLKPAFNTRRIVGGHHQIMTFSETEFCIGNLLFH